MNIAGVGGCTVQYSKKLERTEKTPKTFWKGFEFSVQIGKCKNSFHHLLERIRCSKDGNAGSVLCLLPVLFANDVIN